MIAEYMSKQVKILVFDLFPFLGAGRSAEYTRVCAPVSTLTQLSQILNDNQILCLGRHAQNNSTAPTISYNEDI